MRWHFSGVLAVLAIGMGATAAESPEWSRRPFEIISGLTGPHCQALVTAAATDIARWTVRGNGTLSLTEEYGLFEKQAARLSYQKGEEFVVRFPEPVVLRDRVDGFEFWAIGPLRNGVARFGVEFSDAKGVRRVVTMTGGPSKWAGQPWWGSTMGLLDEDTLFPIAVTGLVLDIPAESVADCIIFDAFGAFNREHPALPNTADWALPFPFKPESIRPSCLSKRPQNAVRKTGEDYTFEFRGDNGALAYHYLPRTGTLSDLSVTVDGQAAFRPACEGGILAEVDGVAFAPGDPEITATLLHSRLSRGTLTTRWRWEKSARRVEFELSLALKKRTMCAAFKSASTAATALSAGYAESTPNPRLFSLTYLNHRWDFPRLLVTDDCFVSVFIDWYRSQATELVESGERGGLKGAGVIGAQAARVTGGALYLAKTDRRRNPLSEQLLITVAPELEEVMPSIPNPRAVFYDETARLVYCTRSYAVQSALDLPAELEFWERMVAYGAKDVFVRYHGDQFRTPIQSNRFCRSLDGGRHLGGDETMLKLASAMRAMLPRVGPYEDNRVIHALAPEFLYGLVSLDANRRFIPGWAGCFQPKPPAQFKLEADFAPRFVAKYGWNACYFDEVTNTPPWGMVDFDATAPGAGTFAEVFRDYSFLALKQHDYYKGPIWSEGNAMFFFAGYLDTDYAQCNEPDALPIVDFKLRKINTLEHVNGYDLTRYASPVDYLISAQIVHGSMGHLWDGKGAVYQGQAFRIGLPELANVLKSYFMMRQLQELYANAAPDAIRYEIDGQLWSATEMLRRNLANRGFIYTRYDNGLEVWANRSPERSWPVTVADIKLELPPWGYAASLPGTLLEYSADRDGHRVDYSRGPLYTYVDGRGVATQFPEITAAGSCLLQRMKGGVKLTPTPFVAPETVSGFAAQRVTGLDMAGEGTGPVAASRDATGRASFAVDGQAFAYLLADAEGQE